MMPNGIFPGASVFDPDGDAWLRFPMQSTANNGNAAREAATEWSIRPTSMGRWGLRTATNMNYGAWAFGDVRPDLAIVPAAPGDDPPSPHVLSQAAASASCAIVFARAQLDGHKASRLDDANAVIVARGGEILAGAPTGVVIAEVEIPACAPEPLLEDIERVE
jgi:hypothetical protein